MVESTASSAITRNSKGLACLKKQKRRKRQSLSLLKRPSTLRRLQAAFLLNITYQENPKAFTSKTCLLHGCWPQTEVSIPLKKGGRRSKYSMFSMSTGCWLSKSNNKTTKSFGYTRRAIPARLSSKGVLSILGVTYSARSIYTGHTV